MIQHPAGARNTGRRGQSKYVRISWDEALEIIQGEIRRVIDKYGPYAILSQSDGHGETKIVHAPHGCARKLLTLLGGYTLQTRNTDSWEGWYWGAKHVWGMEAVGQMMPSTNTIKDVAENSEMVLFWGADPETTPWGFNGQTASRVCYWYHSWGQVSNFRVRRSRVLLLKLWSGRADLNCRPSEPHSDALNQAALRPVKTPLRTWSNPIILG